MTHRVQYNPHLHISLQYAVLVEAAMHDPIDEPLLKVPAAEIAGGQQAPPVFAPTADERSRITALIQEAGDASPADPSCCSIRTRATCCRCVSGSAHDSRISGARFSPCTLAPASS
jgi:hypothetical protein